MFGPMHQLENIAYILWLLWEMVSLHMILFVCVLHKDTAKCSDCVMSSGWLMSGEWNGKKCNG